MYGLGLSKVLAKEIITGNIMFAGSVRNTFENVLKLGFTTATLLMIYTEILTRDVKAVFHTHKDRFENVSPILKSYCWTVPSDRQAS